MVHIYRILNQQNNHSYIGSALRFNLRKTQHLSDLRQNRHHSRYLQRAWNKYGEEAFELQILCICDKDAQFIFEQLFMDALQPEYNMQAKAGCSMPMKGRKHTEETKQKMSRAQRNLPKPSLQGEKHPQSKLIDDDIRRIRKSKGKTQRQLSEEYGVSQMAIWCVLTRKTWKHLDNE